MNPGRLCLARSNGIFRERIGRILAFLKDRGGGGSFVLENKITNLRAGSLNLSFIREIEYKEEVSFVRCPESARARARAVFNATVLLPRL